MRSALRSSHNKRSYDIATTKEAWPYLLPILQSVVQVTHPHHVVKPSHQVRTSSSSAPLQVELMAYLHHICTAYKADNIPQL